MEQGYNLEDKEQAFTREQDAREHDALMEDLSKILCEEWGRRYMWRLLSFCRVMDRSMDKDSHIMAFREGQRDIGIRLMRDIYEAEPVAYETMRLEHVKAEEIKQASRNEARKHFEEEI